MRSNAGLSDIEPDSGRSLTFKRHSLIERMNATYHTRAYMCGKSSDATQVQRVSRCVGSSLRGVAPMLASLQWGKPIKEDVCIGGPPFIMLTHAGESEASIWQAYGVHASDAGISPSERADDENRAACVPCER